MSAQVTQELSFFLISIASGVGIVFAYDFLRILRRVMPHSTAAVAVEDILYWTGCAVAVFMVIYKANDGAIRGYSIAGILLGIIVYSFSVSTLFVKAISFVLSKILFIIGKILYFVFAPLRFASKKAGKGKNFLLKRLKKFLKEVKITLCKH